MSHLMVKIVQSEVRRPRSESAPAGGSRQETPQAVLSVLAEIFERNISQEPVESKPMSPASAAAPVSGSSVPIEDEQSGRYDFDLAEFPLFRFYKNSLGRHDREPLVYSDTIR